MRKEAIFTLPMKDQRRYPAVKFFNKPKYPLQPKMLCFFLDEKNFCLDQMVNSQNNCWFSLFP